MRTGVLLLWLAGCGRFGFSSVEDGVVDAPPSDAVDAGDTVSPDASSAMPAGATLWLRLDDDPTDGVSDSAASHIGGCTQCPSQIPGRVGGAGLFNSDLIVVPAAPDLALGTAFSVAAWIRIDAAPGAGNVIAVGKQLNNDVSFGISITSTRRPVYYSQGSSLTTGTTDLGIGTWHHMALVWDGTTKRGYLDGTLEVMASGITIANNATGDFTVGDRIAPTPIPFTGGIDEVVFYQRALSAAEVAALGTP